MELHSGDWLGDWSLVEMPWAISIHEVEHFLDEIRLVCKHVNVPGNSPWQPGVD
jgi:hypothetical protein